MEQKIIEVLKGFFICEEYSSEVVAKMTASKIEKTSIFRLKRIIKKDGFFVPYIDCMEIEKVDEFFKRLIILYKYCFKASIQTSNKENILVYIKNKDKVDEALSANIYKFFELISLGDIKEIYSRIYDEVCDYLDGEFQKHNYCDFKDDSCACQRSKMKVNGEKDGCCINTFYYRKIDHMPVFTGRCKNLKDGGGCKIKSIGCKLFTCRYLRRQGIRYKCENFYWLNMFWSKKQQAFVNESYFKSKEEILGNLIKLDSN